MSKAGESDQPPPRSIRKAMFLTWSSWLRATTLKAMRRNCCSIAAIGRPRRRIDQQRLLVGVGAGLVEVEVGEGAERLHVQLAARRRAVEAPGHEVAPPVLLQQAALGHLDAGRLRHQRVGVLDRPVALAGRRALLVRLPLTPSNFSSQCSKPSPAPSTWPERTSSVVGIPGDHRLGPRAARPRCRR